MVLNVFINLDTNLLILDPGHCSLAGHTTIGTESGMAIQPWPYLKCDLAIDPSTFDHEYRHILP